MDVRSGLDPEDTIEDISSGGRGCGKIGRRRGCGSARRRQWRSSKIELCPASLWFETRCAPYYSYRKHFLAAILVASGADRFCGHRAISAHLTLGHAAVWGARLAGRSPHRTGQAGKSRLRREESEHQCCGELEESLHPLQKDYHVLDRTNL
jgi:hypothetical protein